MGTGTRRGPALSLAVGLLAAAPLAGLSWPLESPEPASTFGTPAPGRVILGMELASEAAPVRSAAAGELLFARDAADPSVLPSTLGTFVAVAHGDGVAGVYAHLAEGSAAAWLTEVEEGAPLGSAGRSGWIEGPGILFALYDLTAARWVNPLVLLPPLEDLKPPLVRGAALVAGAGAGDQGRAWPLGGGGPVPQGRYRLVMDALDPLSAPWSASRPAPWFLRLLVDGELAAELTWDVAWARGGAMGLFPADRRVLDELSSGGRGITAAERDFRRGRSLIEVLVRDAAGNERRSSWTVVFE